MTNIQMIQERFLVYKNLGEKTLNQLDDEDLHFRNSLSANNIYIIVKHLHGNMLSRFTDFLSSDGEKSWRNREEEFTDDGDMGKQALYELWEEGWQCVLSTLEELTDEDLRKKVTIRGETHFVLEALLRQLSHYAYHVGQIVYAAKNKKGKAWKSLS